MSDAKFMVVKATKIKGYTTSGSRVEVTPKEGRAVVCIVGDAVDLKEPLTKIDVISKLALMGLGVVSATNVVADMMSEAGRVEAPAAPELTPPIATWQQDGDAREWARAFLQHQAQSADPAGFVEEGNLIGWFANAMMCEADRQARRLLDADALGRDNDG